MERRTPKIMQKQSRMTADRTAARSLEGSRHSGSHTREIIIKTEEPDIPLITIFKVEDSHKSDKIKALHTVDRIMENSKMKCKFHCFLLMSIRARSENMLLANTNRFSHALELHVKKLKGAAWLKMMNSSSDSKGKVVICRLLGKICSTAMKRQISVALHLIKLASPGQLQQRHKRSVTVVDVSKQSNHEYSEQFIVLCNFHEISLPNVQRSLTRLEPGLTTQIRRYQKMRQGRGDYSKNEKVLVCLNYIFSLLREVKGERDEINRQLQALQGPADQKQVLEVYQKIENQFKQADQVIKKCLGQHSKVPNQQIKAILEQQISLWQSNKEIYFCSSRTFLSALVVKLLAGEEASPSNQSLQCLIDSIEEISGISQDIKQLQRFRKKFQRPKQKSEQALMHLTDKLIELSKPQKLMEPIPDHSEFVVEIKYIGDEIMNFIGLYQKLLSADPSKARNAPIFSDKKSCHKRPQCDTLYTGIQNLIELLNEAVQNGYSSKDKDVPVLSQRQRIKSLQKSQEQKQISKGLEPKEMEALMRIIRKYKECLLQEDYDKWQQFLTSIKQTEYKELLSILESVNEFMIRKIEAVEVAAQQPKNLQQQLKRYMDSQLKMKQEITQLKSHNTKHESKVKSLEKSNEQLQQKAKSLSKERNAPNQQDFDKLKKEYQNKEKEYIKSIEALNRQSEEHAQFKQLQRKQVEISQTLQRENKKLKDQNAKFTDYQAQMSQLKTQNDQLQQAIKSLEFDLLRLKRQNEALLNKSRSDLSTSQQVQSLKSNLQKQHSQNLQKMKNELNQEISSLKTTNSKQESEAAKLMKQITETTAQITELKVALANSQSKLRISQQKEAKVSHLESLLEQKQQANRKQLLSKDQCIQRLQRMIADHQIAIKGHLNQISSLQSRESKSDPDLQTKLDERNKVIRQLESRIHLNSHEQSRLSAQKDISIRELETQLHNLNRIINENSKSTQQLHLQIQKISGESTSWMQMAQSLESKLRDNQALHLSDLRQLHLKHEEQINGLTQQLKVTEANAQKDVSSGRDNSKLIIILLTNILSNYIRCQPMVNEQQIDQMSNAIFGELSESRKKYETGEFNEERFFISLEDYCVGFVFSEIGRHRAELICKCEHMEAVKQRFIRFLNAEMEASAQSVNCNFVFDQKRFGGYGFGNVDIYDQIRESLGNRPSSGQAHRV